jgi:hypothetical protein
VVVLLGSARYSYVSVMEKQKASAHIKTLDEETGTSDHPETVQLIGKSTPEKDIRRLKSVK